MSSEDDALQRLLADGGRLISPVTAYGPDRDQIYESMVGDADVPDAVAPGSRTVVLVHGGYFRPAADRAHARPMARAIARSGWHVVLAEYRRVPGDPTVSTDDLTALDTHLRETGRDVASWVGHSAGGALVMWRALQHQLPPVRVLALAPVADFDAAIADHLGASAVLDWIGSGPEQSPELYDRLDPTRLRAANPAAAPRIHVMHGDGDMSVPLRQSQAWPRTVLPAAHHFDLIDPASPHWPAVAAALTQC